MKIGGALIIKQNMKYLNYIFILLDTVLVAAALFMAWFIRIESGLMEVAEYHLSFNDYLRPLFFLLPFYYLLYSFFNLYTPYRMKSLYDEIAGVVKANSIGALVFLSYLYFFREVDYSRKVLVIFYFAAIVLAVAERLVIRFTLRRIRSNGRNLKHIVLVGYSGLAVEFAGRISQNKHWGYSISGIFDNNVEDNKGGVDSLSLDYLGSVSDLEDYISVHSVDEVVITIPLSDYTRLAEIINICEKQGVFTKVIPDYYKMIPANPYIEDLDGLPVISIRKIPLNDLIKKAVKRGADILVSLLGIAILVPFFLVISILIKCESKGPVIYKQKRVGFNRHEFIMYKFRSMRLQDDVREEGLDKERRPQNHPHRSFYPSHQPGRIPSALQCPQG